LPQQQQKEEERQQEDDDVRSVPDPKMNEFHRLTHFYRALHFSIEIAWRPSVRLSVTLVDQDHIG